MSNYLKLFGPLLLTFLTTGYTVWGNLPWYAPVAAGVSAVLTYALKNTPPEGNTTVSDETTSPETPDYKPEATTGQDGLGLMGLHAATVPAAEVAAPPADTDTKSALSSIKGRLTKLEKKVFGSD